MVWKERWALEIILYFGLIIGLEITVWKPCIRGFFTYLCSKMLLWYWNFLWRRQLFSWEEELFNHLLSLLGQISLSNDTNDEWLWLFDSSGCFSVKCFCLQVSKSSGQHYEDKLQGRNVWRGVATPKAELLLWFILQERLSTKERLCKVNCIPSSDKLCCFCLGWTRICRASIFCLSSILEIMVCVFEFVELDLGLP